jgi:glycosyltransferase involved in cell wall biosynthesis
VRVLHAADFGGATAGGFIPMIVALARRLRAGGDTMALIVPRVPSASWYPSVREAGVELHVIDDAAEAPRLAAGWNPDVAHTHFYGWEIALTRALWSSRTRLFWHAHSVIHWDRASRASLRTLVKYRLFGARVERFIAVSSAVGDELVRVGAPRRRVVAIPNAVDGVRFRSPSVSERAAARAQLGLGDEPAVLFFGRDPRLKGADILAAALAAVPGATVVTVATPADAREALGRAARLVALDRVDDVVPLYWAADAVAVPSRGEGFGLVLLEAALTGAPVVASDLAALREAGKGHDHVRYVRPGDAAGFGAALRAALTGVRSSVTAPDGDSLTGWAEHVIALYKRQPEPATEGLS